MNEVTNTDALEFLDYCQLVQDAFIASPDDPRQREASSKTETQPAWPELIKRASDFAASKALESSAPGGTFDRVDSASDLRGRLFVCAELAHWMHRQLRVLHSNVVLDRHGSNAIEESTERFVMYSQRPYFAPRLPPSLGHVPRKDSDDSLQFPEWFPQGAATIKFALTDPHFAHGYLYLLSALGNLPDDLPELNQAAEVYRKHWDGEGRRELLRQILGFDVVHSGNNVFGVAPWRFERRRANADAAERARLSPRRKLFYDLMLGVDRCIDTIGDWWKGTEWKFEERFVPKPDAGSLENQLGIVFLEEGEILWDLLHFYACALPLTDDGHSLIARLMDLFWVAKWNGVRWIDDGRFRNLKQWAKKNGKPQFDSPAELATVVAADVQARNPSDVLKGCRSIVPVYAFLMALPPPRDLNRCEIGFRVLTDTDDRSAVKSVWCFSTMGLDANDASRSTLARLIAKQKLLVNLMVGATLREEFKSVNRRTILHHGKRSAISAIMARNMSHNIGSHVLAHVAAEAPLRATLDAHSLPATSDTGETGEAGETDLTHYLAPVAMLNAYLRTRMDFLADIATGDPSGRVGLALRRDVLEPFERQSVLLQHISGIEGLSVGEIALSVESEEAKRGLGVAVSVPNGVLGAHALYVILENLVRNSAKHSPTVNSDMKLRLRLNVRPGRYPELVEVRVFDELRAGNAAVLDALNGTGESPGLLAERITDDSGRAISGAWGLKEMRICAGYLRGLAPHLVDAEKYRLGIRRQRVEDEPPLLEAIVHDDGSLGYQFYLLKPKHVLLVDGRPQAVIDTTTVDQLAAAGITYQHGSEPGSWTSTHEFVVILGETENQATELRRVHAQGQSGRESLRMIVIGSESGDTIPRRVIDELLASPRECAEEFVTELWTRWVKYRYSRAEGPTLVIQADGEADRWSEVSGVISTLDEGDTSTPLPGRAIVYNRHAKRYISHVHVKARLRGPVDGAFSYDAYGANSPMYAMLESAPVRPSARRRLAAQLTEAGACGVIILDERLQRDCEKASEKFWMGKSIALPTLLALSRVFMPKRPTGGNGGVDLDRPTLDPLVAWLEDENVHGGLSEIDFLVVHMGILEKLFKQANKSGRFDEGRASEQLRIWEQSGATVIVTSARGNHGAVRKLGARFVHLSEISRHVLERRSKYHLCGALYAARRLPE